MRRDRNTLPCCTVSAAIVPPTLRICGGVRLRQSLSFIYVGGNVQAALRPPVVQGQTVGLSSNRWVLCKYIGFPAPHGPTSAILTRWILSVCLYTDSFCFAARGIRGATIYTIDDDYADGTPLAPVSYSPPAQWSQGALCDSTCTTHVDTAQTYDHTWHLAEYAPLSSQPSLYVQIQFDGTAVYVYNILSNTTATELTFTLDGKDVGAFTYTPEADQDVLYNALVYSDANLINAAHTLIMFVETGVALFDYAVYTVADATSELSSSSARTSQTGHPASSSVSVTVHSPGGIPVSAGTVAGVIGTCLLALAVFLCCKRRRRTLASSRHRNFTTARSDVAEGAQASPSRIGSANRSYRRTFMLEREGSGPVSSSLLRLSLWSPRAQVQDRDTEQPARTSITAATEATSPTSDSSDAPTIDPYPLSVQPSPAPSKPSCPPSPAPPRTQVLLSNNGAVCTPDDMPTSDPSVSAGDRAARDDAPSEGPTDIHVRYARLQQEVAQLREQQELQGLFFPETLPRYEDV